MSNTFVFKGLKTLLCATAFITHSRRAQILLFLAPVLSTRNPQKMCRGSENRGKTALSSDMA
jgi:hypothetical protein